MSRALQERERETLGDVPERTNELTELDEYREKVLPSADQPRFDLNNQ